MAKKPITLDTPLGTNKLKTKSLWNERTLYRDAAHAFKPYPLMDMWYDEDDVPPGKLLYGRVNIAGDPMFLAEENLKQIPTKDKKTFFVLNFVCDAFAELMTFWNGRVVNRGFVKEASPFFRVQPKVAWISPHKVYHQKQSDDYDVLTSHKLFLSTRRDEKIINLEGFLKVYLEFCNLMLPGLPTTRTQWLISGGASPMFSGLMVEIQEGMMAGDDYIKYAGFVEDESYDLWIQAALRYGFVVDKNAPWRLIADISSPPMEKYLAKYGITGTKEALEAYYVPAYRSDIEVLRQYMKNMYKSF